MGADRHRHRGAAVGRRTAGGRRAGIFFHETWTQRNDTGRTMKILVPLPRADFDPSEVALSWQILAAAGHTIVFATPDAKPASADPAMVSGCDLDFWSRVPGLRGIKL